MRVHRWTKPENGNPERGANRLVLADRVVKRINLVVAVLGTERCSGVLSCKSCTCILCNLVKKFNMVVTPRDRQDEGVGIVQQVLFH